MPDTIKLKKGNKKNSLRAAGATHLPGISPAIHILDRIPPDPIQAVRSACMVTQEASSADPIYRTEKCIARQLGQESTGISTQKAQKTSVTDIMGLLLQHRNFLQINSPKAPRTQEQETFKKAEAL